MEPWTLADGGKEHVVAEVASSGPLERVRVEWLASAFGLLTGLTMMYVPYEFGTSLFQIIYPYTRLLGTAFVAGSATMVVARLYPAWPAWLGLLGRALFLGALLVYWWAATVLTGGLTGALVYPIMMAGLLAESLPRFRGRGFFGLFLVGMALAFGLLMVVAPTRLGPVFYPVLRSATLPVGALYLVLGGTLAAMFARPHPVLIRVSVTGLGLLSLLLAVIAGQGRSLAGMELYGLVTLGCAAMLLLRRLPETSGVGWRLFRGVALASVPPILAVGALASVLAQKAIERELRDKAQQAVAAECAWLEQTASMARYVLLAQARDPLLRAALRTRDLLALRARMELLESQPGPFDSAWILDGAGESLVPSTGFGNRGGNFAYRDYFRQAQAPGATTVYLSRPFLSVTQTPMVAFSVPVDLGDGTRGVLVGGMSLLRLGRESTLASRSYHVEIFDRRGGELLRETERGEVLTLAPVLSVVDSGELGPSEGMIDAFDARGRRLLVTHGQVPGTPWTVALTAPLRQAFAPVTRLSALVVSIALAAGVLALLLSRWVGQDVARRLTVLRDGFQAVGTLPLDHPVPARGDDELTQLTAGFNEMAARIERTQKELREAISTRDQFLSMASHELRTPLTPLKATIELLIRQSQLPQALSADKQRATLERLRRQVDRLTRLIGDMLDVSRMQSGRFSLRPAPMDLSALAQEVIDRIQYARSERTAPILLELPPQPLRGVWDEQRLDQLITNLVENAARYSAPDTPIHVRLHTEAARAVLEVKDEGIGIPPESLSHLFTPFYRAQNASLHHAGGLGLGLAICREIVERHGGTIRAESGGPGLGTRFIAALPGVDAPASA